MTLRAFGALLCAGFCVRVSAGLLSLAGLLPDSSTSGMGWPWHATDAWSLLSDASVLLIVSVVMALWLRRFVRNGGDGWDLRLWPIVAAAALLFALPERQVTVLRLDDSESTVDIVSLGPLVLLVVLARQLALTRRHDPQPDRRSARAIALGGAVALLVAISYQPLHPLTAEDLGGDARAVDFQLLNEGLAARLRSVDVVSDGASAVATELDRIGSAGRPLGDGRLARGDRLNVVVRLAPPVCRGASRRAAATIVSAIEVHIDTLGLARTQRFDVSPPARLRCR